MVTSKRMVSKPPSPEQVKAALERVIKDPTMTVVGPGLESVEICLAVAAERKLTSARIFDLLIYGTMREHGIVQIATFNPKDFENLEGIRVVPTPEILSAIRCR